MTYDAAPDPSARQGRKTVNESQDTPLSEGSWQPFLTVNACGRDWTLERAADMEALWESMTEFTEDERLPYWTELWPSSLVLADWLYQRRESLRGQPCLDLGCGIGLTALVAQWLGANVIGMDYEPEALRFARRNAEHNAVPQPLWTVMDWRKPAVKRRSLRFIWGGDIMYEQRFAAPVLDFLEYALAEGGAAWVAEPSRAVYDTFRSMLVNRRWAGRCVWEKNIEALYPQERPVPVRIWEIHRERVRQWEKRFVSAFRWIAICLRSLMPCANGRDAQAVPRRCATSSVTRWCRIRCIPRPRTRRAC